ncbi:MAG TPA: tetratricopeptide repeat protein [Desulfosarcina sp.]|nr:tetratricopeptide repeat protein [Desulfosarcina sp.]
MGNDKHAGYIKSENVIWFVVAALLVGFVGGVAFGIYKSGKMADPRQAGAPAAMDAERQQAIAALTEQTRKNPDDLQAWIQLGHHYFDADMTGEAIAAYEKALALEPENADVWTDMGVMYRRSGEPEKAVAAFDRAMAIDPRHEISRFNKGIVLFHDLKDEAGALTAWEALLAINPEASSPSGQPLRELVAHIKEKHQDGQ